MLFSYPEWWSLMQYTGLYLPHVCACHKTCSMLYDLRYAFLLILMAPYKLQICLKKKQNIGLQIEHNKKLS